MKSNTMRLFFILIILSSILIPSIANAQFFDEEDIERKWKVSLAPGYGFLLQNGADTVHHGFGGRLDGSYAITPHWDIALKARLGIYDGDVATDEGLFSQIALLPSFRYNFIAESWIQPYITAGLGWIRTEHDVEKDRIFVTHSMIVEAGGGVGFKILPAFWLGMEAVAAPIAFGSNDMNGSFLFHTIIVAELRI